MGLRNSRCSVIRIGYLDDPASEKRVFLQPQRPRSAACALRASGGTRS
jgi:hypothetical protein